MQGTTLLIRVQDLKKSFGKVHALRGVTFELMENEQYVIRGASGSGKSTLLYLLGGLDRPTGGNIWIHEDNINSFNDESLASYRNRFIGFIFQFHFLLSSMSCLDNILLPCKIAGLALTAVNKEINTMADHLGVAHCLTKFPFELSGGEQQRINLIRAMSLKPKLILCDEPTGHLDSKNSKSVIGLLKDLSKEYQSTLVVVTHNEEISAEFSDGFYLEDGKLVL